MIKMVDFISTGLPSAHWPAFFVHRLKQVGRTLYNSKVSHHVLTAVIRSFLLIARHFSRLSFALAAAFYRVAKHQLLLGLVNLSLHAINECILSSDLLEGMISFWQVVIPQTIRWENTQQGLLTPELGFWVWM